MPGAGRRAFLTWHWADADQNLTWSSYDESTNMFQVNYDNPTSSSTCAIIYRKDTYADITILGWGRQTLFTLVENCNMLRILQSPSAQVMPTPRPTPGKLEEELVQLGLLD